ncbi:MAG: hypothetical protein V4669_13635 [Pseudomonadota bacterium]
MTAPVDIEALVGAKLYLCATLPETYDAAGYSSTDMVWTEVQPLETLGEHGGTKTVTPFVDVATGTVKKVGGAKDYGAMSVVAGNVAGDAGQIMVRAAFEANNTHYSAKIVYDDGAAITDETHFMDVLVTKATNMDGGANDVRKLAFDLTLCRAPVIVAPT